MNQYFVLEVVPVVVLPEFEEARNAASPFLISCIPVSALVTTLVTTLVEPRIARLSRLLQASCCKKYKGSSSLKVLLGKVGRGEAYVFALLQGGSVLGIIQVVVLGRVVAKGFRSDIVDPLVECSCQKIVSLLWFHLV